MDVFAHALWTYLFFNNQEWVWIGVLVSFLIDAITFVPIMIAMWIRGDKMRGPPTLKGTFAKRWAKLYNATHSLIVLAAVGLIIYVITGSLWGPLLAWLVHIIMDIPTHSKEFFPTPIFWPISSWTFPGFSWAQPWFMALNYGALILGFVWLLLA